MSGDQNPVGWVSDIGDCTTQLYRDYHLPIEGSLLSSQYKGMPRSLLTWEIVVSPFPDCWIVCVPFSKRPFWAVPAHLFPANSFPNPSNRTPKLVINVVFKGNSPSRQVFLLPQGFHHLFQATGCQNSPSPPFFNITTKVSKKTLF